MKKDNKNYSCISPTRLKITIRVGLFHLHGLYTDKNNKIFKL